MKEKKFIGAHVSSNGSLEQTIIRANELKSTAFAFFLKNHRQWKKKILSLSIIKKFKNYCKLYGYSSKHILPHSSYLINLGHPISEGLVKSRSALIHEIQICMQLGLKFLNIHPGNHLKIIDESTCIKNISDSINLALEKTENITVVIENTAGQGSSIGYKFEQLASIISNIEDKNRIGVCLDTCHIFASGYDLRTKESYIETFNKFSDIIGFKYLCGIHINDSKTKLGSKIDRHHNLGEGYIGKKTFCWIMSDDRFNNIPIILETKNSDLWCQEISWLKKESKTI